MVNSSRRSAASAALRGLFLVTGALLLAAGTAGTAAAQCTLGQPPNLSVFNCPDLGNDGCWGNLRLRPNTISRTYTAGASGPDRISVPLNHGHAVFSLSNPATPSYLAIGDIRNAPVGPISGDGQNFVSAAPGISPDGQRALITMEITGYGSTIVGKPNPDAFFPSGNTGSVQSKGGLVVQKKGSRYIGYGLSGKFLWAADITTTPASYQETPPMAFESQSDTSTPGTWGFLGYLAGPSQLQMAEGNGYQYLYWLNGKNVVLADASSPGPSGGQVNGPPSITASYPTWSIPFSTWGRPAGDLFQAVSVAVDPQSAGGNVYILGAFTTSGVPSFSLLSFNRSTGIATPAGTFKPTDYPAGASFTLSGGSRPVLAAFNSVSNDVDVFMWAAAPGPTANGPKGTLRLYATSARIFGAAIGQTVDLDTNYLGTPQGVSDQAFLRKGANDVYAYLVDSAGAYALKLNCVAGPAPATGHLAVTNTSASKTLSSGDVVFVGDTLQIAPSITPPSFVEAINNWNLDLDFHDPAEKGSVGFFQLLNPDACYTGCANPFGSNPDPPPFTMVGPCDPRSGGTPSTGAGCWSSVVTNGDFPSVPLSGATRVQSFGFEARNVDLGTTNPVPLATFAVTWKIPAVKVQGLAALLNAGKATFTDASDGHPLASGFKWYFGTDPAAPSSETLSQDVACTGASCQHTFPGKGTYNAWLTASYAGGYASPDCGPPCTLPMTGSFVVTVTDFVASFSVPSIAYIGGNNIAVTNQSQIGGGITGVTYSYYLCDASSGSCADNPGAYAGLNFGTGIPVPLTSGTWWLRIKASYTDAALQPQTAAWQPNVVSDPKAWPINVQTVPPVIRGVSGVTPSGGNPPWMVTANVAATFALFDAGLNELTNPVTWTILSGSASPMSATGARFTFTPQSGSGNIIISVSTSGVSNFTLLVYTPPPPTPLSVSVSASPSSAAPNTSISFSVSALGGSGTYTSFVWDFGDGNITPGPASISHPYASAGTYYPSCRVTDSVGAQATGSAIVTISTTAQCPVTSISLYSGGFLVGNSGSGTISVGAGTPLQFFPQPGGAGTSFSWDFGDFTGGDTVRNPAHTYAAPGSYTAQVTVNGTCTVSISLNITGVSVTPDLKLNYSSSTGADAALGSDGSYLAKAGEQVTVRAVNAANGQLLSGSASWQFGDGTNATGVTATKTWFTPGTYPVTVTVSGQAPVTRNVNVVAGIPTAAYSFFYSVNGQAGGPVDPSRVSPGVGILFTSTGPPGAEYYWDFGDGPPCTSATPLSDQCRLAVAAHSWPATGQYTVVLTVKLGGNTFQTANPVTFSVSEPPRWVVPGLAYTSGLVPGSFYVSDVVIQNPSATGWATYSVALLDGLEPSWKRLPDFQPLESRRISNVLSSVFGKAAGGPTFAMIVRGDSVPPNADPAIWAFTYNNNAADPSKGTYGVAIAAVPASLAVGKGSPAVSREFPGLRDIPQTDPPGTSAAYTNIGFINTGGVPATVNVSFVSRNEAGPAPLGSTFPLTIGPNQTKQMTQPLKQALVGTGLSYDTFKADNYYMTFDVVETGAKVIPYASVKDVASTDSIFLSPAPAAAGSVRIPSVVRVNSATGDRFRSRVVIFNASAKERDVRLRYSYRRCPAGGACVDRAEQSLIPRMAAGGTIITDDFVQLWFSTLGFTPSETDGFIQSYLDVEPADGNSDPLIVRGETYNAAANGNFGTQVPGLVPSVHGATAGGARTRLMIPYVVPRSGGSGYRTNVAFATLGESSAQAKVILHLPFAGANLPAAASQVVTVDDKFLQLSLEKLFPELASFPANPGGYYSIEIQVTQGTLAAFAVINDNITSDGSLILAQPLP